MHGASEDRGEQTRGEVRIGWHGGVVVEERSYLAAEDRVQTNSIRLNHILVHRILLMRTIRQLCLVFTPPTANQLGPQSTWMSLGTHPELTREGGEI
jgi:hypothetical protein